MIFVNFKTYEQGTGEAAMEVVAAMGEVAVSSGVKLIPVLQATDIKEAVSLSSLEIWVQSVDDDPYGAHTGKILPEAVLEDGATGTFLNHSENKLKTGELEETARRCKQVGLKTLIFAADTTELKQVVSLKPDFVSYEPPELIGSSDKSVASEDSEIISKAVEIAKKEGIPLIVGAGIHSREDVKVSLDLGASGFAVASFVMKATEPKKSLEELVSGYN